jgi:ABC-type lipoprotein release transport system permease subunit
MGYRRGDISAIFLWQGAMIAVTGSLIGCGLGALVTSGVSCTPIKVRGLLDVNYFLVTWDWRHYLWATILAIIQSSLPVMCRRGVRDCCRWW